MDQETILAKLGELLDDANERNDHVLAAILHAGKAHTESGGTGHPPPDDGGP